MSFTVHHSHDIADLSNLSTTILVRALNLVGAEIQNSSDKMEECVQVVNPSIKNISTCIPPESFLFTDTYKPSSNGDGNEFELSSHDDSHEKSAFFVEF